MILLLDIFYIVISIIFLWKGSEWLVDRAVRIAQHVGVSQLVVGLTIVAFGTSAPEFAVTIGAAVQGQSNISVSNVIGSNVFNLGFIMGCVAIIRAIQSLKKALEIDSTFTFASKSPPPISLVVSLKTIIGFTIARLSR